MAEKPDTRLIYRLFLRQRKLPQHKAGPAVRPHYLLHVILKGRGIYHYKGQTYALSAGDALLIPPAGDVLSGG